MYLEQMEPLVFRTDGGASVSMKPALGTGPQGATGDTGPQGPPGPGTGAGAWQPSTAYTAAQVVQAPDGSMIQRNSNGTSRPSFDATEKAAWTAIPAVPGTMERDALDGIYASLPKPGKHPLTGMFHLSGYGADPTGAVNADAAVANWMADINAAGGKGLVDGIFAVSTGVITYSHDNVRLIGITKTISKLNFTGTGVGVDYDPAGIRRFCGIDDVFLSCQTAGGTAYRLRNSYRGVHNRCSFESQAGTTGTAVEIAGAASTSTYFNRFKDCDAWGSLNSVVLGDNVNGTVWDGGVLEGPGRAVYSPATTTTNGSNVFVNVGIQCEGTNTSGVIVELGTAGANPAITQSSYCTFAECRFETIAATTVKFHENAWYNTILGGSMAATVSVVDNTTQKLNAVLVNTSGGTWNFGVIPVQTQGAVKGGSVVSDPSSTTEMTLDGGALAATGTNANQNVHLKSKGAAFAAVNALPGSGTLGEAGYSGGASPVMRWWFANPGLWALCLFPGAGEDILRGQKSGESGYRLRVDENGKLLWGDGTAAADTNLYRSAANTLKTDGGLILPMAAKSASYTLTSTDDSIVVTGASNTTQTLPSAVTAGAGRVYTLRNAGTGRVTIAATVGTLNGPTVLTGGQSIRWMSDGTDWHAIATSGIRNTGLPPWTSDLRGVVSTSTFNANQAVYLRIQNAGSISKIGFHINVSSGNVDVGVYANNGSTGTAARPGAKLASSGSVACPAAGYQEIGLGSTVYVTEGDWFAFVFDNATASLYRTGAGGLSSTIANGLSHHQSTAFPLPASATPSTGAVFSAALVGVA